MMAKIRLSLVLAWLVCGGALAQPNVGREHILPLFMSTSNLDQQSFARIINHSNESASVSIVGIDDSGVRKPPITLTLGARKTIHLNSEDIEKGNSEKGLPVGLGAGNGNWRLHLRSRHDIEPLAYIRTRRDGFLTSMFAVAPEGRQRHRVAIFNPGSNYRQRSWLRLINLSDEAATVTINGLDDAGQPAPGGEVRLSLPPQAAQAITAVQLESGDAGLTGDLGDGTVKWQLAVVADQPILVMSLMDTPTGHLSNLSAPKRDYPGPANVWKLSFTDGTPDNGYLILTPDSRLYAWLPESGMNRIADGIYGSDAGRLSATGKLYESGAIEIRGLGISGGSESFELTATYRSGDWIKGQYTAGGVSRVFNGFAFNGFDRGADSAALIGSWTAGETGLSYSVGVDAEFAGKLSVDIFDCDLSGALESINPTFNLHESAVQVDCGLLKLNVKLILAVGDVPTKPGGGDFAVALLIAPDIEVGIGVFARR